MNQNKNLEKEDDVIRTPRWIINLILPAIISIAGTWGVYTAQSSATEIRTTHLEKTMETKANSAEVNLGFQYFEKQLNRIEGNQGIADKKLDSNLVKQEYNTNLLDKNIRLLKLNSDKMDRNAEKSDANTKKITETVIDNAPLY